MKASNFALVEILSCVYNNSIYARDFCIYGLAVYMYLGPNLHLEG